MQYFILLITSLLWVGTLNAQTLQKLPNSNTNEENTFKNFYLNVGLGSNAFQDARYSNTVYSGAGGLFGFGGEKVHANYRWQWGLDIRGGVTSGNPNEQTSFIVNPNLYFKYQRKLTDKVWLGGRWDILDAFFNNTNGLGNNSIYLSTSSNLSVAALYETDLKKERKLQVGLDLSLLSFNRENTGFAFSSSQNVLEEGAFDYQDISAQDPFSLSYFELETIGQFLNLRTAVTLATKKRSSFTYEWGLQQSVETTGAPATIAMHVLKYRFNIFKKTKKTALIQK